jgi:TonB family protein
MSNKRHFWRNVALIGVAHAVAVIGLMRWNAAAKRTNAQSIVWVNDDLADASASSETRHAAPKKKAFSTADAEPISKPAESHDEEPTILASAKSEIELPAPTITPTPTAKPSPTPAFKVPSKPTPHPPRKPRPKPTPRPTPKPTPKPKPKKTLLAKVFPRPSPKAKPSPQLDADTDTDSSDDDAKKDLTAEKDSTVNESDPAEKAAANADSTVAGGAAGGEGHGRGTGKNSELASYGRMLHDRFYSEWTQPTTTVASAAKMSTVVRVRIEKDGRVSSFDIVRPSGNVMVDESVTDIGKHVTHVDPLPAALRANGHYDVKINFELNSD